MRDAVTVLAFVVIVIGCVAIGAWLVVQGHPWFGFFAMLIGGSASFSSTKDESSGHLSEKNPGPTEESE